MKSRVEAPWPKRPVIYEINAWIWLHELTVQYGTLITLATVPHEEWDIIGRIHIDAVWLMGVWERSPVGTDIANRNRGLCADFQRTLPDFRLADNVGSPYCVRNYVVDERFGGTEGLKVARRKLAELGIRLILDFVPNHVAPDHPWVIEHPEYFVQGDAGDFERDRASFFETGGNIFACARDPYFPAWPDVVQLNTFHPGLRQAARETLACIADQCDGVRCDMAMLLTTAVFAGTWGDRVGGRPKEEYWREVIPAVRMTNPNFLFIAEAYWDLEWELQQQGFDFCYDKRLYDRLEDGTPEVIRLHLSAQHTYQEKLVRFIENHDEPRAAATFSSKKARAVAVIMATLPGAKLFHEGQFEGRKVRPPVFLGRRPAELIDKKLFAFYEKLRAVINVPAFRDGDWHLCDRTGWPDNDSYLNLLAWCWGKEAHRYLVVVNFSHIDVQGRVRLPWNDLAGRSWRLTDMNDEMTYERDGNECVEAGLYVELKPWGFHIFRVSGDMGRAV